METEKPVPFDLGSERLEDSNGDSQMAFTDRATPEISAQSPESLDLEDVLGSHF